MILTNATIRVATFTLIISSLFANLAFAATTELTLARLPTTVTAEELDHMSAADIKDIARRIEAAIRSLDIAKRGNSNTKIQEQVTLLQRLGDFESQESIKTIQSRLRAELNADKHLMSIKIMEACLNALYRNLASQPPALMEEMRKLRTTAERRLSGTSGGNDLLTYFDSVILRAENQTFEIPSLQDLILKRANTPDQLKLKLQAMQRKLEGRILGQPEMIDAFMAMEWRNQLYKNIRTLPDAIFLMGLPGTGKDTGAEAFTDALWNQDNAYLEHMFRLPIMKNKSDLWKVLGSSTGYIGSENTPPFLEFLVNHSGGRYLFQKVEGDKEKAKALYRIIENSEYKGENIEGYETPDMAVVFANEFHNWSMNNKDTLMKQALEKGLFTINNPNGGLAEIYVPVRFVIAANSGIALLTSREANGQRFGKPLGYDQMLAKWEHIHTNKDALIDEILSDNGDANAKSEDQDAHGTSEELLNRIPERNILLLRPLSPEILRRVAEGRLAEIRSHLSRESGFFHNVILTWSNDMADFVQSYDYLAENNARPIKAKVDSLIEETLLRALRDGDLPVRRTKPSAEIHLSLQKNADATMSLVILYKDGETDPLEVHKLIQITEKDRPAPSISDEQIRQLSSLSTRLKQRVFGIDEIADRIANRVLAIENQRTSQSEESRRVSTIVALGLSSTGKTELAKALAAELLGDEAELITFDFSQIQSLLDFKTRILGLRNGRVSIPSDFMKAYDRNNGKLLVAFDELANVKDPDVLTALYDFFREPIISTFSDGKPRKMGGVMVVVTGNAGQELYKNVPRNIPMIQQMAAMEDISNKVALDSELQRKILERYFPAPLVTRWGKNNVFFFPPHTFKSLRQLAQLKLAKELKRLTDTKSRRGWKVVVPSAEDYSALIDTIVEEGFSLRYQGASIDSFILEDLSESLESLLVKNFVPSDTTVVLKLDHKTPNDDPERPGFVAFKVFVDGSRTPLAFNFKRPYVEKPKIQSPEEQMITAYHEAAHSIIRQIFFAEVFKPGMISIIPGVTEINDEWVVYEGIAESSEVATAHLDRDFYIHYLSIYLAGETAERLVTQGESHTAGKSNDIMRATALAQDVILRLGLSQAWGVQAIPSGSTKAEYLASLSERQKVLLASETKKLLEEAGALARRYLTLNFDNALLPLGNLLIEKGIVKKDEMEAFYARVPLNRTAPPGQQSSIFGNLRAKVSTLLARLAPIRPKTGKALLRNDIVTPTEVADIDAIAKARRAKQFAEVPLPNELSVGTNLAFENFHRGRTDRPCEVLLLEAP